MRGATALSVDAGLFRKVNLTERIAAQFRVEAFNLANRATFLLPIGNAASSITERPPRRRRRCLARHPVPPQRLLWLPQLREPRSSLRLHPVR